MSDTSNFNTCPMDISETDVLEAMKSITGYLDITPADFREIYQISYKHSFDRLNRSIKAGDVMTKDVITVNENTSLADTAGLLAEHGISGLPVIDSDGLVSGVISEKDFIFEMSRRESRSLMGMIFSLMRNSDCAIGTLTDKKASDIMSSPPVTVKKEDSIYDIAHLFDEKKINRVPVVDENTRLLGIVTRSDIVQSFCMKQF